MGEAPGRLDRWDRASPEGPWTGAALRLIGSSPGTRAADLAPAVGQPKDRFKRNVRKLNGLGRHTRASPYHRADATQRAPALSHQDGGTLPDVVSSPALMV